MIKYKFLFSNRVDSFLHSSLNIYLIYLLPLIDFCKQIHKQVIKLLKRKVRTIDLLDFGVNVSEGYQKTVGDMNILLGVALSKLVIVAVGTGLW